AGVRERPSGTLASAPGPLQGPGRCALHATGAHLEVLLTPRPSSRAQVRVELLEATRGPREAEAASTGLLPEAPHALAQGRIGTEPHERLDPRGGREGIAEEAVHAVLDELVVAADAARHHDRDRHSRGL